MVKMQNTRVGDIAKASRLPFIFWNYFTVFWFSRYLRNKWQPTQIKMFRKNYCTMYILQCRLFSSQLAFRPDLHLAYTYQRKVE